MPPAVCSSSIEPRSEAGVHYTSGASRHAASFPPGRLPGMATAPPLLDGEGRRFPFMDAPTRPISTKSSSRAAAAPFNDAGAVCITTSLPGNDFWCSPFTTRRHLCIILRPLPASQSRLPRGPRIRLAVAQPSRLPTPFLPSACTAPSRQTRPSSTGRLAKKPSRLRSSL